MENLIGPRLPPPNTIPAFNRAVPFDAAGLPNKCATLLDDLTSGLHTCQFMTKDSMMYVSAVGPLVMDANHSKIEYEYTDAFGMADVLTKRDVIVDSVFAAPVTSKFEVISNPPIDVHHVNINFGELTNFMWGSSEESMCAPEKGGNSCYGTTFGDRGFSFAQGKHTPGVVGVLVEGRKMATPPPMQFWLMMTMSEPLAEERRALLRNNLLSTVYIYNPFKPDLTFDLTDVPRHSETVYWYSWRMAVSGKLIGTWFHSHSTTAITGTLGYLSPGDASARTLDLPMLDPPWMPAEVGAALATTGYSSVSALQDRVLEDTTILCHFQNQHEAIEGYLYPRFPTGTCDVVDVAQGGVFVLFMHSLAHSTPSSELHEHLQTILYFISKPGTNSIYTTQFSASTHPDLNDAPASPMGTVTGYFSQQSTGSAPTLKTHLTELFGCMMLLPVLAPLITYKQVTDQMGCWVYWAPVFVFITLSTLIITPCAACKQRSCLARLMTAAFGLSLGFAVLLTAFVVSFPMMHGPISPSIAPFIPPKAVPSSLVNTAIASFWLAFFFAFLASVTSKGDAAADGSKAGSRALV